MTLTGHRDGDDGTTGASHLDIARVLIEQAAEPNEDLAQLWTRIALNMLVSNTDDHLRNHGFILVPLRGWRLSEAFDMNPVRHGSGLRLNVSEADNAQDLEPALSVAPLFRLKVAEARRRIDELCRLVAQWRTLADALSVPQAEQQRMAAAFRLAEAGFPALVQAPAPRA